MEIVTSDPGASWARTYFINDPIIVIVVPLSVPSTLEILNGSTPGYIMPVGYRQRIVYEAQSGSSLAINFNGGATLITLQPDNWCEFQYNGTNLILIGFSASTSSSSGSANLTHYTLETLPSPSIDGETVWVTDLGGGAGEMVSYSGNWKRLNSSGAEVVSNDPGASWFRVYLFSASLIVVSIPLSVASTLQLMDGSAPPLKLTNGARQRILYNASSGSTLSINFNGSNTPLIQMDPGSFAEFEYINTSYVLIAWGTL
jgi:hypothetical protein